MWILITSCILIVVIFYIVAYVEGAKHPSPKPVATLLKITNIKKPVQVPEITVAALHNTTLNAIIHFLLNLSAKKPVMGKHTANTHKNIVPTNPTSAGVRLSDSDILSNKVL